MLGCRALEQGQALEIGHLFAGFRERVGTLAVVGVIYLVISLVIALVVGLVTGVGLFSMLGGGADPAEAMKNSFVACLKNIIPFLIYSVILLVLAIVASIPVMLGFLVLGPVIVGSLYASYRDIFFA
jgi:uncharacterized membrane protein